MLDKEETMVHIDTQCEYVKYQCYEFLNCEFDTCNVTNEFGAIYIYAVKMY